MSVLFVATDSVSSFSSWSKESCPNTSFSSDSPTKEGRYPEETEGKREDRHEDIIDESYTYVIHNAGNASNDTMHVKPPHVTNCHKLSQTVTNCHKLSHCHTLKKVRNAGSAFELSISLSQEASQSTSSTSLLVEIGRLPRSCSPDLATTSSCPRGESIGHNLVHVWQFSLIHLS